MPHATSDHPLSVTAARPWWLTGVALGVACDVTATAAIVTTLTGGLTTRTFTLAAVLAVAAAAASLVARWVTSRAWAEVPGGWWSRLTAPRTSPDVVRLWVTRVCTWVLVSTLLFTAASIKAGEEHQQITAWLLTATALAAVSAATLTRRGPTPVSLALALALILACALSPVGAPVIAAAGGIGALIGLAVRLGAAPAPSSATRG